MKIEEKKKLVMENIAKDLPIFYSQARIKLIKRKELLNTLTDYKELVSDVIFSVINKLDKIEYINKFYNMYVNDTLKLYILKGIDRNCTSFNAPFLSNKLKNKKFKNIDDNIYLKLSNDEPIFKEKYPELTDEQIKQVNAIHLMCKPDIAKSLFGPHWKYFINLLNEYIEDNSTTYKSLGLKYDIPVSSIGAHIQLIKRIIKQNISNYINII